MADIWLRTDEREDVIASLKIYIDAISKVNDDSAYWKWAIISLHSALQGTMAFHLGFGNDLLVMRQEDAEAWLNSYENGTPYPKTKMDSFLKLYAKIKKHEILNYRFRPSGQQGSSIKRLNTFRNEFIHFMPRGWSIEMSGMPNIFNDCLGIINALGNGPIRQRWENDDQLNTFTTLLNNAITTTNHIHR